jgi:hypothetical protein
MSWVQFVGRVAFPSQLRDDGREFKAGLGEPEVKRPRRRGAIRYPNKPKYLDTTSPQDRLEHAAVQARYEPSPYHCRLPSGQPPMRRTKPATHCPDGWTLRRSLICVREAIRARRVSRQWIGDFPRHVWHKNADVWYEACTNNNAPGVYHAYPIETSGLPPGLTP